MLSLFTRRALPRATSILPSPFLTAPAPATATSPGSVSGSVSVAAPFTTTPRPLAAPKKGTKSTPSKAGNKPKGGAASKFKNASKPRAKKQQGRSEAYARVKLLKQNLYSPAPPPLRMGRLRWLRHWTVHRAWLLLRRQRRDAAGRERMRLHAGMYNACEELRRTDGPAGRGEGYLYRVAMEKKGVWGTDAVPIEYARFQTEYAGANAWNHEWKRNQD
ncbi:hypothetical protein N3K66_005862 [Trichothecium roseum]|uniref:Uncharacterized protein n=1 Tax=Trichothecium roseum TaxID=47278 RepID=A0ACC0UZC4_9HYPO|nr:hypothetical protein N3K66_005862 [Trichothecium roseum]